MPIIAASHALRIHIASELGRLIAADTRLAGPHGKAAAIQREIAHLLPATPHRFAMFCV